MYIVQCAMPSQAERIVFSGMTLTSVEQIGCTSVQLVLAGPWTICNTLRGSEPHPGDIMNPKFRKYSAYIYVDGKLTWMYDSKYDSYWELVHSTPEQLSWHWFNPDLIVVLRTWEPKHKYDQGFDSIALQWRDGRWTVSQVP